MPIFNFVTFSGGSADGTYSLPHPQFAAIASGPAEFNYPSETGEMHVYQRDYEQECDDGVSGTRLRYKFVGAER